MVMCARGRGRKLGWLEYPKTLNAAGVLGHEGGLWNFCGGLCESYVPIFACVNVVGNSGGVRIAILGRPTRVGHHYYAAPSDEEP
eukprot:51626-Rhodomonas_salina.4